MTLHKDLLWVTGRAQCGAGGSTHQDDSEIGCRSTEASGAAAPDLESLIPLTSLLVMAVPFHDAETGWLCAFVTTIAWLRAGHIGKSA